MTIHFDQHGDSALQNQHAQGTSIECLYFVSAPRGALSTEDWMSVAMPRFFLHVRGADQRLSRDELGLDFPDLETAFVEVFCAAMDMRREFTARGENPQDYVIAIANASHELVFDLPFSYVFDR